MGTKHHWEGIYASKDDAELSWHQQESGASYHLISEFSKAGGSVIDIGGGSSSLAAQLVIAGFRPVTVLDISRAALARAQHRVASSNQSQISWQVGDILTAPLLPSCDVWHDRAVFHFLTEPQDQACYVAVANRTVRPHGVVIVGAFGPEGPEQCSGLPVHRYDGASLAKAFGDQFSLKRIMNEDHITPSGALQPFVYVVLERIPEPII